MQTLVLNHKTYKIMGVEDNIVYVQIASNFMSPISDLKIVSRQISKMPQYEDYKSFKFVTLMMSKCIINLQ